MRWTAVSFAHRDGRLQRAGALDRIELPAEITERISGLLTPGASLIVSDRPQPPDAPLGHGFLHPAGLKSFPLSCAGACARPRVSTLSPERVEGRISPVIAVLRQAQHWGSGCRSPLATPYWSETSERRPCYVFGDEGWTWPPSPRSPPPACSLPSTRSWRVWWANGACPVRDADMVRFGQALGQQAVHAPLGRLVEGGGRLVEEQPVGLDRAARGRTPGAAARRPTAPSTSCFRPGGPPGGQPAGLQHLAAGLVDVVLGRLRDSSAPRAECRSAGRASAAGRSMRASFGQADAPAAERPQPGQHAEQRGLAAARGAAQRPPHRPAARSGRRPRAAAVPLGSATSHILQLQAGGSCGRLEGMLRRWPPSWPWPWPREGR